MSKLGGCNFSLVSLKYSKMPFQIPMIMANFVKSTVPTKNDLKGGGAHIPVSAAWSTLSWWK